MDGDGGRSMLLPAPFTISTSGIYAIVNRDNGKIYIGSAVKLGPRWNEHRLGLRNKKHHSPYLQRAFNKHPDSFYIELVEELPDASKTVLLGREQFWMDFFRSHERASGYNISPTARSCQGIKRSPEFLAKVSAALIGKKMSPEHYRLWKIAFDKRKRVQPVWSPAARLKQRNKYLGTKRNPESVAKMSAWIKANPTNAEPVSQYSKEGIFIASFKTIREAEMFIGVKRSNISGACKGKRKLSNGFMWRYTGTTPPESLAPLTSVFLAGGRYFKTEGRWH